MGKLNNEWIVIGVSDATEEGFEVEMRSEGNNPKEVAEDIAIIAKFASSYERIEFSGDHPVLKVDFSNSSNFEKFSKLYMRIT